MMRKSLIYEINFWSQGLSIVLSIIFEFQPYKIMTCVLVGTNLTLKWKFNLFMITV